MTRRQRPSWSKMGGLAAAEHEDVADLRNSTEGWVAALQLACAVTARTRRSSRADRSHVRSPSRARGIPRRERARQPRTRRCSIFCSPPRSPNGSAATLRPRWRTGPRGQALLEEVEKRGPVPAQGRRQRGLVPVPPPVRRVPAAPPRTRSARAGRRTPPHGIEVVRRARACSAKPSTTRSMAGDQVRAVELVERDGTRLIEQLK